MILGYPKYPVVPLASGKIPFSIPLPTTIIFKFELIWLNAQVATGNKSSHVLKCWWSQILQFTLKARDPGDRVSRLFSFKTQTMGILQCLQSTRPEWWRDGDLKHGFKWKFATGDGFVSIFSLNPITSITVMYNKLRTVLGNKDSSQSLILEGCDPGGWKIILKLFILEQIPTLQRLLSQSPSLSTEVSGQKIPMPGHILHSVAELLRLADFSFFLGWLLFLFENSEDAEHGYGASTTLASACVCYGAKQAFQSMRSKACQVRCALILSSEGLSFVVRSGFNAFASSWNNKCLSRFFPPPFDSLVLSSFWPDSISSSLARSDLRKKQRDPWDRVSRLFSFNTQTMCILQIQSKRPDDSKQNKSMRLAIDLCLSR